MASSGDVQVVPEPGVEVDQLAAVEACDGGNGSLSAKPTTTKEESVVTTSLQEQRDTVPEPADHHEAAAAPDKQQAAEASSAPEKSDDEGQKLPVANEEIGGHTNPPAAEDGHQDSTRERLKRHRMEVAGRVWVPEKWGQEKLLKDWVDCAVFDRPLVPPGLLKARRALVAESSCTSRPDRASTVTTSSGAGSSQLRVRNGCSS